MIWNPFKNNQNSSDDNKGNGLNSFKMNMLQKIAMKKLERMSPAEREKMIQDFLSPQNKEKMLAVMEQMRKSGQITEEQYNEAKKRIDL